MQHDREDDVGAAARRYAHDREQCVRSRKQPTDHRSIAKTVTTETVVMTEPVPTALERLARLEAHDD